MHRNWTFLLFYSFAVFVIVNGQFKAIDTRVNCDGINTSISFDVVREKCYKALGLAGTGTLKIEHTKERLLYNFFLNKRYLNLSILIEPSCKAKVVSFGNVQIMKSLDPNKLALVVENTDIEFIEAEHLVELHGAVIKGNRYLAADSLYSLKSKAHFTRPALIQPFGECNMFYMSDKSDLIDFEGCHSANNLYLPDEQFVPETFYPKRIVGCVYLSTLNLTHNMLRDINFEDVNQMDCDDSEFPQAIVNNPTFCIKEFNFFLSVRNILHGSNDNIDCRFKCYEGQLGEDTRNDITDYYQRWCETLDGDLTINNDLIDNVNLTEVLMHLKTINGKIIIENLDNDIYNKNNTVEEIVFPALETITGGAIRKDVLIFVNNTKNVKRLKFPKLIDIINAETAMIVTDSNPDLRMSKDDFLLVDIAANGLPIEKPKSLILEDPEDEGPPLDIILGSVFGSVGLVAIVAIVVVVVVVVRKKKSKKSKKGKKDGEKSKNKDKEKTTDSKDSHNAPEGAPLLEEKKEKKKEKPKGKVMQLAQKLKDKIMKKKTSKSEENKAKKDKEKKDTTKDMSLALASSVRNVSKNVDVEKATDGNKKTEGTKTTREANAKSVADKTQTIEADT